MKRITEKKEGDSISASDWNAMVRELDRLGRLSVSGNLELIDGPGGIVICANSVEAPVWIRIVGKYGTTLGKYKGRFLVSQTTVVDTTTALASADFDSSISTTQECVVLNLRENRTNTGVTEDLYPETSVTEPLYFLGTFIGQNSDDGYPVYVVDGLKQLRC